MEAICEIRVEIPTMYLWGKGFVNDVAKKAWDKALAHIVKNGHGTWNIGYQHKDKELGFGADTSSHMYIHPMELVLHETMREYNGDKSIFLVRKRECENRLVSLARVICEVAREVMPDVGEPEVKYSKVRLIDEKEIA